MAYARLRREIDDMGDIALPRAQGFHRVAVGQVDIVEGKFGVAGEAFEPRLF